METGRTIKLRLVRARNAVVVVVGLALAMGMTGCSSPGPVIDPTPDRLVVTGTGVSTVNSLGDVLDHATFRQPLASMYRVFRSAFGKPTYSSREDGRRYDWGHRLELREGFGGMGAKSQLYVGVRSYRGVRLMAAGLAVGDDFPSAGASPTCSLGDAGLISVPFLPAGQHFAVTFESRSDDPATIGWFQAPRFSEGC